jgi:hypothetical protein
MLIRRPPLVLIQAPVCRPATGLRDCWVSHWNDNPEPFVRTKPADEILDKVTRGQATLDRITKSATHH